jgi:hypothetical protein
VRLRRLTTQGIERMSAFLDSLTTSTPEAPPYETLTNPAMSEPAPGEIEIEQRTFASRFDVARYLDERLGEAGTRGLERDRGVWAWLALLFFESLCPVGRDGRLKPGARARWIPEISNFQRYYRHLLCGPYLIYRAHRDDPRRAMVLLYGPPSVMGEVVEQLASRQQLITNRAVVAAATGLYFDSSKGSPRRGFGGKGPGSPRRLADVLNQLDLTWDLYAMSDDEVLAKLPSEFDRFKILA